MPEQRDVSADEWEAFHVAEDAADEAEEDRLLREECDWTRDE